MSLLPRIATALFRVEVPWTKSPKNLQKKSRKSLPGRGPKSLKKSWKRPENSQKNNFSDFSDFFFDFSDLFRHFFRTFGTPPPGDFFETFFGDFLGFWSRDSLSQVHGTSILVLCFEQRNFLRVLSATFILSKSSRVLEAKSRLKSATLS